MRHLQAVDLVVGIWILHCEPRSGFGWIYGSGSDIGFGVGDLVRYGSYSLDRWRTLWDSWVSCRKPGMAALMADALGFDVEKASLDNYLAWGVFKAFNSYWVSQYLSENRDDFFFKKN